MGYGDYSYTTDKTKGHVNQYYVDKFRIAADFVKGAPASAADAMLGCDAKHSRLVPKQGVPQSRAGLPAMVTDVKPDPRVAESEGAMYPWDVNYVDPQYLPEAYADITDENVASTSFQQFRASVSESRGKALTALDFGAQRRVERIKNGFDESYLLCFDGALDANYARLQKISDPPTFTPTGTPQTEIPGTPYLGSVGAMDLIAKPGDSIATWKNVAGMGGEVQTYKRPGGKDTPELPYNTAPTVEEMKDAQAARGILGPVE